MVGRDTYLEHLASVPLFAACSQKDLQRIARASDEVQIPEGRTLVKQGDVGRECFVLVEGKVKVERNGRKVATLGPGAYFGELSLLDKGPARPPPRRRRTAPCSCSVRASSPACSTRCRNSRTSSSPRSPRIRELDTKAFG